MAKKIILLSLFIISVNSFSDEKELTEKHKQKIDKFIQIIFTDPKNPALYEMVERVHEDTSLLSSYLESYFEEKIKAATGEAQRLHYHLISLHFRFRRTLPLNWPTLIEGLTEIKEGVERLKEKTFRKLFYKMFICCLGQMADRKKELADCYKTEVLPHWKDYFADSQEILLKAIFEFYFGADDSDACRLTIEIFDQLLHRLDEGQLSLLHLSVTCDVSATFAQKRAILIKIEEKINDLSAGIKTRWLRLQWELEALRKEEIFMTKGEWQKAVEEGFEQYLALLKRLKSNHWLRPEMELAVLHYLSLGADWNEDKRKSYFDDTDWTTRKTVSETIRRLACLTAERVDRDIMMDEFLLDQYSAQIGIPVVVRARLLLGLKMKGNKKSGEWDEMIRSFNEKVDVTSISLRELNILTHLELDKYFRCKVLARYIKGAYALSSDNEIVHKEAPSLFSRLLTNSETDPQKDLFVSQKMLIEIFTMIGRTKLTKEERIHLFSKLLENPRFTEAESGVPMIIQVLQELGKTKSDLAIETIKKFLVNPFTNVVGAAAQAMVDIGKGSVAALIDALRGSSCVGMEEISDALVQMGEDAASALMEAYFQTDLLNEDGCSGPYGSTTKIRILQILKEIKSPKTKDFLIDVAISDFPPDESTDQQYYALNALVEMDRAFALELMFKQLESSSIPTHHKIGIIQLLLNIKPPNLIDYFIRELKGENTTLQIAIIDALSGSGDNRAKDILLSCFNAKESDLRARAVDALVRIRNPVVIPKFIESLCDSDSHFREHLISGLAEFGWSALSDLVEALSHADPAVWEGARDALLLIGGTEIRGVQATSRLVPYLIEISTLDSTKEITRERLATIIRKLSGIGRQLH